MPIKAALVTGGAGFIGSHVATELVKRGHCVVVLDDLSGGQRDNVPAGALFEEGSVLDAANIERLFKKHRFDHVFHLAAYAAEGLSHFIKRFNYQNNLVGSVNLINASVNHGVRCFVFTSSIAVYGASQMPATEDTVPRPEDPYGISKAAVEMELEATRRMFGLDYVIFRPHNVYGEGQNIGDRYRNVVGIFMNQILSGKPMSIFGDGEQTRAFSYIGDVAPFIANAADVPAARNQVFNIGADTPYTLNHLAAAVAEAMGVERRVVHLDERREVKHAFSSHGKFASVFGRREAVPLEKGLARMAARVKKVGARESRAFGALEIEKNLPPSWRSPKE